MATIGSLVVNLGLASASFSSGLKSAQTSLSKFQSGIKSFATSTTGILTGVAGAFGVALGASALKQFIGGQMEAIDQVAKLSDRLGITTEALVGLQHGADLAGISTEQLTGGLEKMLANIGKAAIDGGEAAKGFEAIGLSAQSLADMGAGEAFGAIAEGLKGITNTAERSRAAVLIFGKAGQSLMPMMLDGKAGIEAARIEAEKLGLTFSRVDAAKVEAANDSLTRMSAVFTGIGRTLAIELAPFVDALATKFTEAAKSGEGMGQRTLSAMEYVIKGVATLADWLKLLEAAWQTMRGVASIALSALLAPLQLIIEGIDWLYNKITGSENAWGKSFARMGESLAWEADKAFKQAGESWSEFEAKANSKAVAATFADIRAKAEAAGKAIADAAPKPEAMPVPEWQAFDTTKGGGFQMISMKAFADMKQQADDLTKSLRTPTQVYGDELAKLDGMLQSGAINYQTYLQGIAQAQDSLKESSGAGGKTQLSQLKEQRFSFTYRAEKQGGDPVLDVSKLALAEHRKQTRSLATVERSLTAGGTALALAEIED
jgi:hypothetical protein